MIDRPARRAWFGAEPADHRHRRPSVAGARPPTEADHRAHGSRPTADACWSTPVVTTLAGARRLKGHRRRRWPWILLALLLVGGAAAASGGGESASAGPGHDVPDLAGTSEAVARRTVRDS